MPTDIGDRDRIDLAEFRSYLLVLAQVHVKGALRAKVGPSDVVQEAMLEAHRAWDRFRGETPQARIAWLRTILVNCIHRAGRDHHRDKRDIRRECSLEDEMHRSSLALERSFAPSPPTASEIAMREEHLLAVCEALLRLPEAQRVAVLLKYVEGLTQAEIGARMHRSTTAVAGLIHRGLVALRKTLGAA